MTKSSTRLHTVDDGVLPPGEPPPGDKVLSERRQLLAQFQREKAEACKHDAAVHKRRRAAAAFVEQHEAAKAQVVRIESEHAAAIVAAAIASGQDDVATEENADLGAAQAVEARLAPLAKEAQKALAGIDREAEASAATVQHFAKKIGELTLTIAAEEEAEKVLYELTEARALVQIHVTRLEGLRLLLHRSQQAHPAVTAGLSRALMDKIARPGPAEDTQAFEREAKVWDGLIIALTDDASAELGD